MTTKADIYMGFTIKVYVHPVAGGFVPFCQVMGHGVKDEEFNLQPSEKLHETAGEAIREAIDWGRDLVDKLTTVPELRLNKRALSHHLSRKEEQQKRNDTNL